MRRFIFIAFVTIFSSGCAVGVKHQYDTVSPEFNLATQTKLAVGVQDLRPYVVSGKKPETFVGLSRGGFGNPFDVNTQSGAPLAKDMRTVIAASLKRGGATVIEVELKPSGGAANARQAMLNVGADKAVLMSLREWKSDTYTNTALHYDVLLTVLAANGDVLATKDLQGRDNLGGSFLNPPEHARNAVPEAFRRKLEELFSDPAVAQALR